MDRRTIEGLEACRPDSDDLRSPELSDVARRVQQDPEARIAYERVQAWDASVSNALEQVPVPPGLAERILSRLVPADLPAQPDAVIPSILPFEQTAIEQKTAGWSRLNHFGSRRQWLAVGSMTAAGLLVAAFLSTWLRTDAPRPLEILADGWLQGLAGSWQPAEPAPRGFALPSGVAATPMGWQQLSNPRGVAYKLSDGKAGTATLFVVRLSVAGLPIAPPPVPQSTTGGKAVAYWQSGSLVYVLVIEGNERSYRNFVSVSATPLA